MIASWRLIPFIIILLGIVPILAITDPPDAVMEVEFLDGVGEAHEESEGPYIINTSAYWNTGPELAVSVAAEGDVRPEAMEQALNFIAGNLTAGDAASRWNALLTSFPDGHAPTLHLASEQQQANIKVILTEEDHPEGKMGKTRLYAVKGIRHILSVEVYIYSANRALDQGMLEHVLAHEMGHALGLSHSTNPESIMFSLIELQNGSVVNHIGSCEENGMALLYVESRIGPADC
ncbi:MAG: matrixin family metalloprotease [Nitrososphaera sp.]|uniref:matrixin family metalloprotease n=1 Tax=Nitrososphaera sp. TaxID=1971748 RepID=UPI003D6DD846